MTQTHGALLTILLLLGGWGGSLPAAPRSPEDGQPLLKETIAALGGATYLDVKNVTSAGRLYEFRNDADADAVVYRDMVEYPDKVRTELGKKRELVLINRRLKGWVQENGKARAQTAEEIVRFLKSQQHDLDRTLRWRIPHEKCDIVAAGKTKVEDADALQLDFVFPGVEAVHLFVDATSKLPIQFSFKTYTKLRAASGDDAPEKDKAPHDDVVQEEISYSNYHAVSGIQVPFHVQIVRNGQKVAEMFLEEVQFNNALPEALFENPLAPAREKP